MFQSGQSENRFLVGIIGAPASGKSYLAAKLPVLINRQLDAEIATSFAMDAYHYQNDFLLDQGIHPHKGCHFTFDVKGFTEKLVEIKEGNGDILCPIYDRSLHNPTPNGHQIKSSHRMVMVEGNYLLTNIFPWNSLKYIFNYTLFIEVDPDIQYERLLDRHTSTGKSEKEAEAKIRRTDLPNAELIEKSKIRADYIFHPQANFK